jgi:hypothetical protein
MVVSLGSRDGHAACDRGIKWTWGKSCAQRRKKSGCLRRATQVQARDQQLAAGDGWDDVLLLSTHGQQVSRA